MLVDEAKKAKERHVFVEKGMFCMKNSYFFEEIFEWYGEQNLAAIYLGLLVLFATK